MLGFSSGIALTEVLVAILVLALGVLGGAGMQLNALRSTRQSSLQTQASNLGNELADRIAASGSDAVLLNKFLAIDITAGAAMAIPSPGCYTASCNALEMTNFDIAQWVARLNTALPNAHAKVCRDNAPHDGSRLRWACNDTGPVVIKIGWQGRRADDSLDGARGDTANSSLPKLVMAL